MATVARLFQEACRARRHDRVHHAYVCLPRPTRSRELTATLKRRRAPSTSYHQISGRSQPASTRSASTSSGPSRRAVTVTSDDGRYNWSELSTGEKAARGTQQTFNFLLVSLGLVGTITVAYFLYQELLAPSSSTVQFNAAVSRIKSSPECRALLGPSSQILAYGEPTSSKWARARPLAHSTEVDRNGTTHLRMHFNVEGKDSGVRGVVTVHMTKPKDGDRLEYQLLSLSVKGHETVYLENKAAERGIKGQAAKMFGVQWR
ncbi:Mitochondrial import inner membrane translocase subunit tim21 [Cladophialophora carrionii]|uniref:Mitochondrial import inner membrane translocase subunit Tim21 n=1 Tax=Cladophialophora carrionii TaxID=86049 RepID=A0A1C1CIS2_9EURO|nr:Mitochondrial import inner membrane translocase subunit tim21 [Cladophialophora carrionii]